MKYTNYIIAALIVAVIALYVLHFIDRKGTTPSEGITTSDSIAVRLPIAFIRTDSLLTNYNFYKDLNEASLKKLEGQRSTINQRTQQFQKEVLDFQQKAQNNAFLTRERMNQEEVRLGRKQQELEEYAARAEQELAREQIKMQQQLTDTIMAALKVFNTPQKYQVIFSNVGTDNFFYADDSYDITQEIINFLNGRYVPEKQ